MWSAIKSDLLDFVNTIQTDTQKVVEKVMGEEDEEEEELTLRQKRLTDLKRSYDTYANVCLFNLSSYAYIIFKR